MDTDLRSASRTPRQSGSTCWLALIASLITAAAVGQTYQLVYSFRNLGEPRAGLTQASDGNLYGTTHFGGTSGVGTIFRVDGAGELRTLHSFGHTDGAFPDAGLIEAADGNFYGTTSRGGAANRGTVFRMNPSGRVERLHSFSGSDGATPVAGLVQASDGRFYGTASEGGANGIGTIFRIDTSGNFESLHNFSDSEGAKPSAALIQTADGDFYGTTVEGGVNGQGTVFRMNSAGSLSTIRNLTWDEGIHPYGALLQASDGNFYGTASEGGARGQGTIFRLGPGGDFVTLHSFNFVWSDALSDGAGPQAALIEGPDGVLYGTTARGGRGTIYTEEGWGAIFKTDFSGNVVTLYAFTDTDGKGPHAGLVQTFDGWLYGTTPVSGIAWQRGGTVFRFEGPSLTTLHEFSASEGWDPNALIQASDGNFYGLTFAGGAEENGTIFRVTPSGAFTTLHDFAGVEGWGAQAALLEASDGYLYGATLTGGKIGGGAIFRADFSGNVTLVHEFSGPDGIGPASALIQASDGYLYGTAYNGGDSDDGTIFRMGFAGQWQTMHAFSGPDGANPAAALLEASDGKLYGTTWGPFYHGTVFRISIDGEFESLHTFNGYDGVYPYDALIQATDGDFYSTTYGSIPGFGTVFKIDSSGNVTTLHRFEVPEAYGPQAGLVQAGDGDLYGTTMVGGVDNGLSGYGTAFRMTLGGDLTLIHLFNGFDGGGPSSKMIEASDGSLWGTAALGPLSGSGIIYRFSSDIVAVNGILPTSGPASEATAVQLFGGGFSPEATVTVGGGTGTEVTVADPTFLYLFTPLLSPGTLNDVSVTVPDSTLGTVTATHPNAFFADFLDVPQIDPFHDYVEKIFRNGITAGCGGRQLLSAGLGDTRAQMAVFLLKSEHGSAYAAAVCTGVFGDVPCPSLFADWIEQLAAEGITAGCGGGNYCPINPGHARADGRVPAEDEARLGVRAAGLRGPLRRRALPEPLRRLDRAARGRGDHGRLRRRELLSRQPQHAGADVRVSRQDIRDVAPGHIGYSQHVATIK